MINIKYHETWNEDELRELKWQINLALEQFPELQQLTLLKINKITGPGSCEGKALYEADPLIGKIALRFPPTMHTIGHELMHVAQQKKLVDMPRSETATDIFTTARSSVFNDHSGWYIPEARDIYRELGSDAWRIICLEAILEYKRVGKYAWVKLYKLKIKECKEIMKQREYAGKMYRGRLNDSAKVQEHNE